MRPMVGTSWMICLAYSACLSLPMHEDDRILLRRTALWYKALDVHLIPEKVHASAILLEVRGLR